MRRVVVIGAGIVGASAAWNLARSGIPVLVAERAAAPATVTSAASFSRATAFGKAPASYFRLNQAGVRELHRLHRAGVPGFHPCPSLVWAEDHGRLAADLQTAARRGYQTEGPAAPGTLVPAGLERAALPALAGLLPGEGWVDLPAMAAWMLDQARGHGAEVCLRTRVTGISTGSDGTPRTVRFAGAGEARADVVINAAGTHGQEIAGLVGGPLALRATRGLLADFRFPGGLHTMILGPDISIRPAGPGAIRARSDRVDARLGTAQPGDALLADLLAELTRRCSGVFPMLTDAEPLSVLTGTRAIPADGLSSVGFLRTVPGYYEAVTHSGATVGPLLGRLIAWEIGTGRRPRLLAPFSPDRFITRTDPADTTTTAPQEGQR